MNSGCDVNLIPQQATVAEKKHHFNRKKPRAEPDLYGGPSCRSWVKEEEEEETGQGRKDRKRRRTV